MIRKLLLFTILSSLLFVSYAQKQKAHISGISWAGFSPDNNYAYTIDNKCIFKVWDMKTGKLHL